MSIWLNSGQQTVIPSDQRILLPVISIYDRASISRRVLDIDGGSKVLIDTKLTNSIEIAKAEYYDPSNIFPYGLVKLEPNGLNQVEIFLFKELIDTEREEYLESLLSGA